MTSSRPPAGELAPAWLAHRYDPGHDAVHFVEAGRPLRGTAAFLTDELLSPGPPLVVRRADAVALARRPAPLHFIFHSAYCCSTLLARALDIPGTASALKEPQILNDLVGWRHRGADAARLGEVLGSALALLARPFEPGEAVVIKPSNVTNGLASAMLELRPESKAVLLHAPLPAFVASIARKGMWGRLWVRELLSKQLADGMVQLGFAPADYLLHTDLQAAAVGWLAQQALFARLAAALPERVRSLNSEQLVAQPAQALDALIAFYGLTAEPGTVERMVAAEFSREAKAGGTFLPEQRAREREAGLSLHAEEIHKVAAWAEAVAANAGVPMTLPAALIG